MKNCTFCFLLVIIILLSNAAYASEADDLENYLFDTDISEIYAHNLTSQNTAKRRKMTFRACGLEMKYPQLLLPVLYHMNSKVPTVKKSTGGTSATLQFRC